MAGSPEWPALEAVLRKTLGRVLDDGQVDKLAPAIALSAAMIRSHEDRLRGFADIHEQALADPMTGPWAERADPEDLDEEQRASVRERFANGEGCMWCGGLHLRACPRVRKFVFRGRDDVAEVEFFAHGEWPTADVLFPEDFGPSDE